jgi:hypothetical protein
MNKLYEDYAAAQREAGLEPSPFAVWAEHEKADKSTATGWVYARTQTGQPIVDASGERICDMDCVDLWAEAHERAEGSELLSTVDELWEELNEEREDRAALITASPDLLAALKCIVQLIPPYVTKEANTVLGKILAAALPAIDKAKGA